MMTRVLRAELLKSRRAPVWIAFLVLPLIPAFLGTANYLNNLGILQDQWYSLWSQHTLFSAYFFQPALLAVYCAWLWRLENTDHNFNSFLTAPVPRWQLYLGKLFPAAGVAVLSQLAIGLLYVAAGKLVGLSAPLPPELGGWLLFGAVGSIAVCAVQLYLSLLIHSFAIPVALGLVGGIGGFLATAQGWGLYFPYSLLSIGMRANNPNMALDVPQLVLSAAIDTLLFAALTICCLSRRDVRGD